MDIKYYDRKELAQRVTQRIEPPSSEWVPASFGGVTAAFFTSPAHQSRAKSVHTTETPCINESQFELCMELSVLQSLDKLGMTFMELGAGWGAQSLTIAMAVRNSIVDMPVEFSYCYAVEAEPGHYEFLCMAFQANKIHGLPIFGAVADTLSWPSFYAVKEPADNYGQSLHPRGNIQVPCFTIENLVQTFKIEEVDLVHMDIQGAEPQALQGTLPVIDHFRYLIVCPHFGSHVDQIGKLLEPTHNCLLSFGPASGYHELPGFPLPIYIPQDGIMLWERK